MAQIEYKILQYHDGISTETENEWNILGKDGWELVTFGPTALDINGYVGHSLGGFVSGDTEGKFACLTAVFKRVM